MLPPHAAQVKHRNKRTLTLETKKEGGFLILVSPGERSNRCTIFWLDRHTLHLNIGWLCDGVSWKPIFSRFRLKLSEPCARTSLSPLLPIKHKNDRKGCILEVE